MALPRIIKSKFGKFKNSISNGLKKSLNKLRQFSRKRKASYNINTEPLLLHEYNAENTKNAANTRETSVEAHTQQKIGDAKMNINKQQSPTKLQTTKNAAKTEKTSVEAHPQKEFGDAKMKIEVITPEQLEAFRKQFGHQSTNAVKPNANEQNSARKAQNFMENMKLQKEAEKKAAKRINNMNTYYRNAKYYKQAKYGLF